MPEVALVVLAIECLETFATKYLIDLRERPRPTGPFVESIGGGRKSTGPSEGSQVQILSSGYVGLDRWQWCATTPVTAFCDQ